MKEKMYQVTWGVGVLATSPREAALKARLMQLDAHSEAMIFYVRAKNRKTVEIDLGHT